MGEPTLDLPDDFRFPRYGEIVEASKRAAQLIESLGFIIRADAGGVQVLPSEDADVDRYARERVAAFKWPVPGDEDSFRTVLGALSSASFWDGVMWAMFCRPGQADPTGARHRIEAHGNKLQAKGGPDCGEGSGG